MLATRKALPGLEPVLDSRIERLICGRSQALFHLVAKHGSPLNIVWPHVVAENVERLREVLLAHDVDHEIFYAAKVNKSRALVRAAAAAGVGVDVSSLSELDDALAAGVDPARICATGPAKTSAFHERLVIVGALIAVDSLEELDDLEAMYPAVSRTRVLLRLRPVSALRSRFGMDRGRLERALRRLAQNREAFVFEGFHIHLGGYDIASRAAAMDELADLVELAESMGLTARMIDIGGGLPVRYVDPQAYAGVLGAQERGDYYNETVPLDFYPYGSELTASDWLKAFLRSPCRGGTVASYVRARGVRLAIEPGRSLVDQGAISIFRITRVKSLAAETSVIFVEGSSFSACETWCRSEFLVDPILVPIDADAPSGEASRAYIAGHSCLDDDVISYRLLDFGRAPRRGDLLIWANTAGYQMDLLENEFHRHPMPVRLVAGLSAQGELFFMQDK